MTLTITNNNDNILFMGHHLVILEDMVVNNSNSNSKVDFRLAELCLGSGIWFGKRSYVDGEQRHCISEVCVLDILAIQMNKKSEKNKKSETLYQ